MTEVERTGSVTKAAANLFMGQPNLSKAIKEVENEIGITVFRRSAKGVYPTPEGAKFLARAKAVLDEMGKLEALYKQDDPPELFTVCVPQAEYVPELLAELARVLPDAERVNIECMTAPFYLAAENVSEGICKIAAVRCPDDCKDFFAALINEKNLRSELLISGQNKLIFSAKSPLSEMKTVTPEDLSELIRISVGEKLKNSGLQGKKIVLRNGSDPCELLSLLPDAYMLSAPVPESKLRKYGLVQSDMRGGGGFTDHLIYPSGYKPDEYTSAFTLCLKKVINKRYL